MHRPVIALAGAIALAVAFATVPTTAGAAPTYAPAATATIHPGVQTFTNGGQCTANFVFTSGAETYIGQAAHCSGTGEATETNGCTSGTLPIGTPVQVGGASQPGTLVYSSWNTMQAVGETDPDACAYNDLALIKLAPADVANVNPSIPHWGGPTGLNTTGTTGSVYSYGNSSLRQGITLLSPKLGLTSSTEGNGWTHVVNTVTPGIPGDSGSAFLDADGRALGVLSTLGVGLPGGVVNNVSDLNKALDYLHAHGAGTVAGAQLVLGTETFNPSQLPLDAAHPVGDPVGSLRGLLGV
ncbi:MAG: serine protease [Ilumatobacteraceae bacterium]|nr:serine protease [Ilumatobacteraceae bacterium]